MKAETKAKAETTQSGMSAQDIMALIKRHLEKHEHEERELNKSFYVPTSKLSKGNDWLLARNSGKLDAIDRLLYAIQLKEKILRGEVRE
jgi:hypothetical protein